MDNYEIDQFGVIRQVNVEPQKYDIEYVKDRYNMYPTTNAMSHMRLGYLLGTIGKVPNSILDVGYGNGSFLTCASSIIPNCYGEDISGYPLPPNVEFIQDITSRHFDVITFFDSLEHFPNLDFVSQLQCEYLFISVPWCHNISDEWFINWKHRRENEHIHHFNDKSLISFMKSKGFVMVNISNFEDCIRKSVENNPNILSVVFKKEIKNDD